MNKLDSYELKNIRGGFGGWAIAGLVAFFVFAAGVLEGFTNPLKCVND